MNIKITLVLVLFSSIIFANPFVKPSEPNGMLNFSQQHPSKDIFPVSLFAIDGKQIIERKNAVWLKPGTHTLRFRAAINLDQRSKTQIKRQKQVSPRKNNSLEIDVQEGKMYFVGYDTSERDPNLWRPVVWKVEDK